MVTVIIPNFNHALYLQERIDSVLNQTFREMEVIILDDCSTDNSKEEIEKYREHPKVKVIEYNQENSGSVFKQWKKGIELANGEYIWIAESDDYASPLFLEKMVPFLKSNPTLGLAYCDAYIVSGSGSLCTETFADKRNKRLQTSKWSNSYVNEGVDEIKENLLDYCTVNNASGVLFRKGAIFKANPFDRKFRYIGDWYCYLKLCKSHKIGYLNEKLNFYREHGINASRGLYVNFNYIVEYYNLIEWVVRELDFISKQEIQKFFSQYLNTSLVRGQSWDKLKFFSRSFQVNPSLFCFFLKHNLPFLKRFKPDLSGTK